jgi:hypothetical protein
MAGNSRLATVVCARGDAHVKPEVKCSGDHSGTLVWNGRTHFFVWSTEPIALAPKSEPRVDAEGVLWLPGDVEEKIMWLAKRWAAKNRQFLPTGYYPSECGRVTSLEEALEEFAREVLREVGR